MAEIDRNSEAFAKSHPLWDAFSEWANDNGIDADEGYWEDSQTWWSCFLAGATAFANGRG